MNTPVATERKSFLPLRLRSTTVLGSSSTPTVSRSTTPVPTSMPLAAQNDTKSSLTVGNRVLVNGLKSGILRYTGSVQFARGFFCGIELDEPDGKHDGKVNETRYFQCKVNHGIFVPHDKVVLAPRKRANTIQRPLVRLKPPTMTRSMTISSSANNTNEQVSSKSSPTKVQLPDIIPSPATSIQSTSMIETISEPIITDVHEIITPVLKAPSVIIDEPPEIIEADFTDSVSLILHQLQQEPQSFIHRRSHSFTISEEGTIDDDDIDDMDNESIAESMVSEINLPIDPIPSVNDAIKFAQSNSTMEANQKRINTRNSLLSSKPLSYSNKSLASSTASIHKLKINPIETKRKPNLPTPTLVVKKVPDRKLSVPLTTAPSTVRRLSLAPPKKPPLSSVKSSTAFGSQSKLNQSLSSSTSVNSSRSDLTSKSPKSSKLTPKFTSNTTRGASRSIDLGSKKNPEIPDHQFIIYKVRIQSLESTNEHLKKQYQHLLNQFDLMSLLNQYYLDRNEQIKDEYQCKLSKVRGTYNRLKTSIDELRKSHRQQLITFNEQYQHQLHVHKENHKHESVKYQQEIDKLTEEKFRLDIRCSSLQDQVDRFMEEMASSEHADLLLRHVETLEKDRTSLQTVLEFRNQELTQLRTRMNEQVFQREDQLVLQKRIDMVENRNQELVCLLRNWQFNEKGIVVERDQLKEQLAQLERDNQQLTFEKETLLYSLRRRSTTISYIPLSNSRPIENRCDRAHSIACLITTTNENERLKHSSSLNCILNR